MSLLKLHIYSERVRLGSLPWLKRGCRLDGVNLVQSEGGISVEPVYVPLLLVENNGAGINVFIGTQPPAAFALLLRPPFFLRLDACIEEE